MPFRGLGVGRRVTLHLDGIRMVETSLVAIFRTHGESERTHQSLAGLGYADIGVLQIGNLRRCQRGGAQEVCHRTADRGVRAAGHLASQLGKVIEVQRPVQAIRGVRLPKLISGLPVIVTEQLAFKSGAQAICVDVVAVDARLAVRHAQ